MAWGKPGTGVVKSYAVEWSTMEQTTAKAAERVRDERVPEEEEEEDEDPVCPLCIEELDATEIQFRPCPCGYRVCLFCYERIKLELKGICPSCRSPYGDPQMAAPPQPTASGASSGKRRGSISRNGDSKASEQGASIAGASLGVSILGAGDHRCHSRVSPAPPILASSEFPTLSSSPPLSGALRRRSRAAAAAAGGRRLSSDAHAAPSGETTATSWPALKAEPATAGPSVSAVSSHAQTGKSASRDSRKESGGEKGKEAGRVAEGAKAATVASAGSALAGRKQQPQPQTSAGASADVAVSSSSSSAAARSSAKASTRTISPPPVPADSASRVPSTASLEQPRDDEMLLNSPGRADLGASAAQATAAEAGEVKADETQSRAGERSVVQTSVPEPASSVVPKPSSSVPSFQRIRDAASPHSTDSSIPLAAAGPHGSISSPSFSTWLSPHSTSSAATLSKPVLSTPNGVACNGIAVAGWASSGGSGLERLQQLQALQRQLQQAFVGPVTPPPGFRPSAPPGFAPLSPPPGFGPSAGAKKADAGALGQADMQAQAAAAAAAAAATAAAAARAGSGLGLSGSTGAASFGAAGAAAAGGNLGVQTVESAAWGWGAAGAVASASALAAGASSSASFCSPLLTSGYSSASGYTTTSAAGYSGAAGYFSGYTGVGGVSGRSGSEVWASGSVGAVRGTWGGGDADAAVAAIASIWGQENSATAAVGSIKLGSAAETTKWQSVGSGLQSFTGGSMSIPMSSSLSLLGASIWSNGSNSSLQPSQPGMWGSSPLARSPSPQLAAALSSAAPNLQGGAGGARAGTHLNQRCILAVDRGSINASLLADTSSADYLENNAKHLPSWLSSQLINQ
ncbi:unnamed protein product [Closterium sp. NIES-65]|nr:unnamed protein product [Closterium sp. NIES-65]